MKIGDISLGMIKKEVEGRLGDAAQSSQGKEGNHQDLYIFPNQAIKELQYGIATVSTKVMVVSITVKYRNDKVVAINLSGSSTGKSVKEFRIQK